jgi:hypothetical protein
VNSWDKSGLGVARTGRPKAELESSEGERAESLALRSRMDREARYEQGSRCVALHVDVIMQWALGKALRSVPCGAARTCGSPLGGDRCRYRWEYRAPVSEVGPMSRTWDQLVAEGRHAVNERNWSLGGDLALEVETHYGENSSTRRR